VSTAPPPTERNNLAAGIWLLADMALNIWALAIVKALGLGYPSVQIVFLRTAMGAAIILPWVLMHRRSFAHIGDLRLHGLRILLSFGALNAGFFAIARMPIALFTTVNFTRPIVMMVLAALLLAEPIGRRRWLAAAIALIGVIIAANPFGLHKGVEAVQAAPLLVLCGAVIMGTGAIIATRRLRTTPTIVMMAAYTFGIFLLSAPLAMTVWTPIATMHLLPLLLIGVFAQAAQLCFLRAHYLGEAGYLAVLGYLSLVLSASVGYFAFDEIPTPAFVVGAAMVIATALWTARHHRP